MTKRIILASCIVVVIVVAPALRSLGIPELASHLFVFWFAIGGVSRSLSSQRASAASPCT